MKNVKFLLLSLLFVFGSLNNTSAQETLDAGAITMEIKEVSSDNEQMEAQMQMMKGSQTEYFFNKEKSLTKMNMMGGMINMSFLYMNESEDMTMLFDMMGNKMMVESTKESRDADQDPDELEAMQGLKVTYNEADTKEILGYTCVKADISNPDSDEGMAFSMYISRDIKASANMIQGLSEVDLEGFPLAYELITPQMTMTMEAVDLKKTIEAKAFEVNTTGYQKMSMDEFKESMGGMGGFGF